MNEREPKKLCKSRNQKMLCGVCGGVAEYFNVDVTIIRLLVVLFGFTGSAVLIYIVAAIIIPEDNGMNGQY